MKLFLSTLIACFTLLGAKAQKCDGFYFLQNGKTITMTNYGRKDKMVGTVVHKISSVKKTAAGVSATVNSQVFDDKNESVSTNTAEVQCSGGVYKIDLRMLLNEKQLKQLRNYEGTVEFFVDYPAGMKTGDVLKDATFSMNSINSDGLNAEMEMTVDERTVLAQEEVTTPAGTWNCFKIKSHVTMKATVGGISIPFSTDNVEWFAPGLGVVKTETKYGRTELSSIK